MSKLSLGVIFGGQSSEYSVSLHSAASFLRSIHADRYDMHMIGIDPKGHFYLYTGPVDAIEHDTWKQPAYIQNIAWQHKGIVVLDENNTKIDLDCVFPVLHGKNGEDGCIQGLLELMNIHYVGCDVLSSSVCMDKDLMHIVAAQAGIPAADYITLYEHGSNPDFEEIQARIPLPWIVKPCNAGSSYGVHFVENKDQFEEAVKDAFYYDGRGKILVEKAIDGFEIGCAVMGNEDIKTGSVDEIETGGAIFDFEGKYQMKDSAIHCPARIDAATFQEAQALARKSYKAFNCSGLARVDMFVTPDGVILNEVNTIPGMTDTSRYPSMMKEAGLAFEDLIDQLIELAMQRTVSAC